MPTGFRHSEETRKKLSDLKIGHAPYQFSLQQREQISCKLKGRSKSEETKRKMSLAQKNRSIDNRGEKNPNWRGGLTSIEQRDRKTREYVSWRKSVFERDAYTCQSCGQVGGKLQADHIKPFSVFPELRTVVENGRTLCVHCHRKTMTYGRPKALLTKLSSLMHDSIDYAESHRN